VLVVREGEPLPPLERSVVTVGVFDGVHRGHQQLIAEARSIAGSVAGPVIAVVFDPHPIAVGRHAGAMAKLLLSDLGQRLEWLDAAGVDVTYLLRWDEARSLESRPELVRSVLVDPLHAAAYVSGEDHHLGHRTPVDAALMAQLGAEHGIKVSGLPMLRTPAGDVVSSDLIRDLVAAGDVVTAADLLTRPFELRGVVEHGDHRGRDLGFPTANIAVAADIALPRLGIYAGWYVRPDGTEHPAAINVGRRPTFYAEGGPLLIEPHLLDFAGDLYGEQARVRFVQRLRDEVRFDGVDALIAQMHADVDATRRLLLT
jgi:riboflavin kinase / FMN adenylyltransferase